MYLEILLAILAGVASGTLTGLIPGIHINLISLLVLTSSPFLLQHFPPLIIAVFIISMAVTHSFLDSIPGIYLGAPDESMALAALPGHRMLLKGLGHHAVLLTIIGSFLSLILCLTLAPSLLFLVKSIYPIIKNYIGHILIIIMAYMILKDSKRKLNFIVFSMSSILGLITLNIANTENVLFPLLSGLFGFSILIKSILSHNNLPGQIERVLRIRNRNIKKAALGATSVGFMASFLPGFGSSQAAIIATQFLKDIGDKGFLILVGGINTVNMTLSLITLYALEKARNGAVIVISKILQALTLTNLITLYASVLIAGCCAVWLAVHLSKLFSTLIQKVNYKMLVISILLFTAILVFYFDSFIGILILITSTAVGLFAGELGVGKNHCMGCLILPVILYFIL